MIKPIVLATLFLGLATGCATYNKSPVATYDNAGSDGGPVNQIVNADNAVTARQQPFNTVHADKSGGACYENLHCLHPFPDLDGPITPYRRACHRADRV